MGLNPKPQTLNHREREFFFDNLLVRIHFIIVMTNLQPSTMNQVALPGVEWVGLAPLAAALLETIQVRRPF